MKVKRAFDDEVKNRASERQHTLSLTMGQRYVMRELSVLFRASEDEDQTGQITVLEKAFRNPLTKALQRELNQVRRNGVTGDALLKSLVKLYNQHNLRSGWTGWHRSRKMTIIHESCAVRHLFDDVKRIEGNHRIMVVQIGIAGDRPCGWAYQAGVVLILDIDSQAARTDLRSGRRVRAIAGPHRSLRARARSCTMC